MKSEEKIFKVLQTIKSKVDLAPTNSIIDYRAGQEGNGIFVTEEVSILNKLGEEGVIDIVDNFGSEWQ